MTGEGGPRGLSESQDPEAIDDINSNANKWQQMAKEVGEFGDGASEVDVSGVSEIENTEAPEYDPKYEAWVKREVFEKVNQKEIVERISEYGSKIDIDQLIALRSEINMDLQEGLENANRYFAKLLELRYVPEIKVKEFDPETGDLGGNRVQGEDRPDLITVYKRDNDDADSLLETVGHECWHALQNDMWMMRQTRPASDSDLERAFKYSYNRKNYIKPESDLVGYSQQLMEAEAYTFGLAISMKNAESHKREKWYEKKYYVDTHPEIYGEGNLPGIERELHNVLDSLDVEEFVRRAGVERAEDLLLGDLEDVAQGFVDAVSGLAGMQGSIEVEFVDELKGGFKASSSLKNRKIWINREKMRDTQVRDLANLVWGLRQRERAEDETDERGRLYADNALSGHYVQGAEDEQIHRQQLMVREARMFADDLVDLLDEKATEDEIMGLPFMERLKLRMRAKKDPNVFQASKKYKVGKYGK